VLDIDNVLLLFSTVLLEQKLLLVSSQFTLLTYVSGITYRLPSCASHGLFVFSPQGADGACRVHPIASVPVRVAARVRACAAGVSD
jgi:hypothetical protein